MSTPANGLFSGLFSSIGAQIGNSPEVAAAEDKATQAFYTVAGELFIVIILLTLMLARNWER